MAFRRVRSLQFPHRLWPVLLPFLLPAALLLWAVPTARAASRIYWADNGGSMISFASLNGTGHGGDLRTTGVTPNGPIGIALDLLTGKIYWADNNGNAISFARLNNTGGGGHLKTHGATPPSGPAGVSNDPDKGQISLGTPNGVFSYAKLNDTGGGGDLLISGASTPNFVVGIAIDPATGRIYWTDGTTNKISFANLDGTGHGGDLKTKGATVAGPQGLAIDPANGKIYWANDSDNTHPISFANLNDTGHGGNLDVKGATANAANDVAIDPEAGKLYWANYGAGTISFAKLNDTGGGGELKTSGATAPNGPVGLALLKRPLATARPKIRGGSTAGSKLSCSRGRWAPDLLGSFLYQRPVRFSYGWSRNGKRVAGATKKSITASRAGTYTCTVTAKNEAGRTKKKSASHKIS